MNYQLVATKEHFDKIVQYLATKPYKETFEMINFLQQNTVPVKEEDETESSPSK